MAKRITVIIPCFNEQATIEKVVTDFRNQLPDAKIVVIDNNSTDKTATLAKDCGAEVLFEARQGKGFAVEKAFREIASDVYILVDGDDTYPAEQVHQLIALILNDCADMVVGARARDNQSSCYRPFHIFGNKLVNKLINKIFNAQISDAMSGYRAFNSKIVRVLPVVSSGFEIETEMTIQCLYTGLNIKEVGISYKSRPEGSESKLNTFQDGLKVLSTIFQLFKDLKPLMFFGFISFITFVLGLLAGLLPVYEYFSKEDNYITHVPLAILATSLVLLAALLLFLGIMLDSINYRFRELHSVITRNVHSEGNYFEKKE